MPASAGINPDGRTSASRTERTQDGGHLPRYFQQKFFAPPGFLHRAPILRASPGKLRFRSCAVFGRAEAGIERWHADQPAVFQLEAAVLIEMPPPELPCRSFPELDTARGPPFPEFPGFRDADSAARRVGFIKPRFRAIFAPWTWWVVVLAVDRNVTFLPAMIARGRVLITPASSPSPYLNHEAACKQLGHPSSSHTLRCLWWRNHVAELGCRRGTARRSAGDAAVRGRASGRLPSIRSAVWFFRRSSSPGRFLHVG